MRVTYGYEVEAANDEFLVLARLVTANLLRAAMPLNFLVNLIPALKYVPPWMPGGGWKREVLEWRSQKDDLVDGIFNWTKRAIQAGVAQPSVVRTLLADVPRGEMELEEAEDHIKHMAATMFAAGAETTVTSFMVFVLAMTLYPEVQADAQAEIDRVIGPDRLPNMHDQNSLPYVNAVIQEVNRWLPAIPLGMPHRSVKDDVYRGCLIPKGAIVIGNLWAITHDPAIYPDPETFNPRRFFEEHIPPAPIFGWGRRICPGLHIADSTLFIAYATVLAAFTISKARDENGEEIIPDTAANEKSLGFTVQM
ncbi:cytochrome P450 family protein [Ceratobasidium sp. AG-Ba]|nr:cytochrome P450 family protein [Ceratobasidium sp. AG-Ba]